MRASLVLLVAVAACSDSSGPHQIPVLTTHLSSSVTAVGSVFTATLTASNPTDTTLHLYFTTPPVVGEIKISGAWQSDFHSEPGLTNIETLSLAPGAIDTVGSVGITILPAAVVSTPASFALTPGNYEVRACYFPTTGSVTTGAVTCGNTVTLTVTQ